MGLRDFHFKFKAFKLRRFLIDDGGKKKKHDVTKKQSWMTPISHGYHVVGDQSMTGGSEESDSDSVVVQREQIEELELWLFGVFDARVGDGITKYLQAHLFERYPKEAQIRRKSKETTRKAYVGVRAKIKQTETSEENRQASSASVMVLNGEKLVVANMGNYRAVVCRNGVAHQLNSERQLGSKRHWSRRLFSVRILGWTSRNAGGAKSSKGSELAVGTERIDSGTEFVIVASSGIWEVMKNQEAVSLIRHIEDPQEAAECLAKEALTRMSRSNVSCIVIRFD